VTLENDCGLDSDDWAILAEKTQQPSKSQVSGLRASLETGRHLPGVQIVTAHKSNLCTALIT
jgi:hypothetical protein